MAIIDVFKNQSKRRHGQRPQTQDPSYSNRPKKVVVSVGNQGPRSQPQSDYQSAREIIQDARDEVFRIKKAAEEEAVKIRQESLELEKRIAQREENLDSKL